MLEWIKGQNEQFADGSTVLEPPETPAPVFAIRAFKSALFGTPAADDEENARRQQNPKNLTANPRLGAGDLRKPLATGGARDAPRLTAADVDTAVNAMASPTKSILVTPGTASNRRKTVSFGESVVDNERKRDEPSTKSSKTPTISPGNISSQWSSGSSDKSKPRSKLTQALMDSREKSPGGSEVGSSQQVDLPAAESKAMTPSGEEESNDDTVNLNEPRSQSGKYWKAEFDSYRTKTTREIRKLIQYRSAAKSYARKKDEEAVRLAEKLKEEEVKVSEMERHVTQLASTMVTEKSHADKEKLVQELTKQTALALQYKHRVGLLRKLLERHGVVGDDIPGSPVVSDAPADTSSQELRKTQQELGQANAQIEEMKKQQSEFTNLKNLAQSSEQKASELEKENALLKQTLARVKQEMVKYEGRRKDKEAKLKQRESKLETRIQEYRERFRTASQQHRELEDDLKASFNEERRQMQEQIDLLNLKVTTLERLPELRARTRPSDSPRKSYPGVQVHDFAHKSPQKTHHQHDETTDVDEPPSPSPRAKDRRSLGPRTALGELDVKMASKALGLHEDDDTHNDESLNIGHSPRKTPGIHLQEGEEAVPASSPPDVQPLESITRPRTTKQKYNPDSYRSYLPSHTTMTSLAHHLASMDESQQVRTERLRPRRSTKFSLDALSGLPETHHLVDRSRKRQSLSALQKGSIPIDRMIAAQARIKRRDEHRKIKDDGKENIRAYSTNH
ncbi:hypothetical protein P170DRAFT_73762 [Aspergillus steynii IBT 23096]|uniref:Spindle pole body-associated protein cut12 domain-containing protein n=1 Tax=Aspergillus steynii IBT 23096 TaxID=1392250 RepID=A0A2I2FRC8_9EURO|nr:uncharacterized protein P170DRAFT_73762 [Aspergillus steynii IBT 23096]PLB43182.1 hypothetical protein P170DRAFT_73762 [Aspergillus steynii IBT 23096]